MGQKRKRDVNGVPAASSSPATSPSLTTADSLSKLALSSTSFQIIAGSYDRVLHGLRVTIPSNDTSSSSSKPSATFTPLFLFTAHASSIRCLAVSPPSDADGTASNKRTLATSSPDTKINLYHLHTRTNLGTLAPPSASPTTSLVFPSKSTLISTDEAGYIHIFRTRDWSLLSSLHCPAPKPRPGAILQSGGVNALAVHPSGKLALSVSRGERAVRMWNLMTGRKAGVLVFPRSIPRLITGLGDGIKVTWRPGGKEGYAVMFERGVVLFGVDSEVRGKIVTTPVTKVHNIKFLEVEINNETQEVCFVATEDGRVVVYSIPKEGETKKADEEGKEEEGEEDEIKPFVIDTITPPSSDKSRIKDFDILPHPSADQKSKYFLTTANSEGIIRVYTLDFANIHIKGGAQPKKQKVEKDPESKNDDSETDGVQIQTTGFAQMAGEYSTDRRITCLTTAELDESAVGIVKDGQDEDLDDSESDSEEEDDDKYKDKDGVEDEDDEEEEWGGIEE
ncbi:hypothetical protein H072_10714 [Dactylellina haptotyla CBS 200.50]|uniref:Anaphase-promoting complex subunit 4 WD40 domain-containing protein n=1 Tax=Dactylellina haptotyla (strain CBS 200.50) TaxID=1284197 RepID=S8A3P7_DACHA|nr:hypothetical protein H072_10714 [Dactylellina haptotyla CBS 200.50]